MNVCPADLTVGMMLSSPIAAMTPAFSAVTRVRTEIRDELEVSGLEERIGPDRIFLEVDDAVREYLGAS